MVQFIDLWRGHPVNESVSAPCLAPKDLTNLAGKAVDAGFPVYPNQCAIRMGIALHRAGIRVDQLGKVTTCGVHGAQQLHTVNARQLADAIRRARLPGFGDMEVITGGDVANFYTRIFGRTGVIYIQDYWMRGDDRDGAPTGDHIDVWNGYRSSSKWLMEWFSWAGYYSNYANAREMWFWPVK